LRTAACQSPSARRSGTPGEGSVPARPSLRGGWLRAQRFRFHVPALLWLLAWPGLGWAASPSASPADLPNTGLSLLRVMGALALVLGLFLGGVWLFRNWQRFTLGRGRTPKLNIVEARPLGQRHALYVVGFEDQRFLVASSPAGVNLLSHLPPAAAAPAEAAPTNTTVPVSFGQILGAVLARKGAS
jgi:flagellar biogenesis protein FliO